MALDSHANAHLDELEVRDPAERERDLFGALPAQISHAKAHAPYFAALFADVDPAAVVDRNALARLPVTRKSELHQLQKDRPPFGGMLATAPGRLARIFVSPGPLYDPEEREKDYWRTARPLYAAGFRAGDIVQNCFSYHLSPAASMFEGGCAQIGCVVVPGGTGQTEMQASTMAGLGVNGYVGTPSFLKLILEKADELGYRLLLKKALVSGEAFLPPVRGLLEARGIEAYQAYATADLGTIAYETPARDGLVIDEALIVEILRPGTGLPVAEGEVGEVVVTTFSRSYPLIRFATGDLSAIAPGASACGRTNMRIKGWMGRADQATKVRGVFVHPHQIAEVVRRFAVIDRARAVVENAGGDDRLRVLCAVSESGSDALRHAIEKAVREITTLRGEVEFVEPRALPNDGNVIDDLR